MTREGLRKYEFYLHPDVMDIILEVSAQRDLQLDKGLSQIVQEWSENRNIEPLNSTPKPPNLSELLKTDVHLKLSKQFTETYEKNYTIPSKEYVEDRLTFLESWFSTLYNEITELPIWEED